LGFCETPQAFRSKKVRVLSIIATPNQKSPGGAFLVGGKFRKKSELILNKIPTAPPDDEVGWSAEGAAEPKLNAFFAAAIFGISLPPAIA
jgi:hypothetical protein